MIKKNVVKSKCSHLNDKIFYFPDGIVSLPSGHKNLNQIDDFKKEKDQKIKKHFWEEKEVLFNMEKKPTEKHPKTLLLPPDPGVLS